MCEEAPVFSERTSVGLDVHARSVVAAAIDGDTGEVFRKRLTPGNDDVIGWVRSLPGPDRTRSDPLRRPTPTARATTGPPRSRHRCRGSTVSGTPHRYRRRSPRPPRIVRAHPDQHSYAR